MSADRLLRVEDERLLRGRGAFVHNRQVPGVLEACFVRSPHAHARVVSIGADAARATEGVVAVLTGTDFGDMPMPAVNPIVPPRRLPDRTPMARDRVHAVGDPVALVIATSGAIAHAAALAIEVDYDPLAAAPDHHAGADDASARVAFVAGDPAGAFADAATRVEVAFSQPRTAASPLEPRGVIAECVGEGELARLHVHLPCQSPARARDDIAHTLGLPASSVRVIAPDVGGAFGAKASIGIDEILVVAAAWRLRRAVRWLSTRNEDFVAAPHGRGARLAGRLALDAEGGFLAVSARLAFPLGAWLPFSALVPMRNAARILPGPYRVTALDVQARAANSNAAPMNIYRGAGRPEAAILVEALVDAAARRTGRDPVALRLRNLIRPQDLPLLSAAGERLDSGDFGATLRQACALFDYDAQRARQRTRRAAGELVGIGVAVYVEPCGQGWESARVTATADGGFEVASGSSAQGQGHETSFARIAASGLGEYAPADPRAIRVVQGDTDRCPDGIGALASRSIAIGGSAILVAAQQLRERLAAGAARPCAVEHVFHAPAEAWSHGAILVGARLDRETGAPTIEMIAWVDDAGVVIDPELAQGQLLGGLAQGLGQALFERIVYDDTGQLLTGSLMDYALPRAGDVPPVRIESRCTPTDANRLGAKGVGEAGCIGVPAAIYNAVADALASLPRAEAAIATLQLPLVPERIWRAIQAAAGAGIDRPANDHPAGGPR